MEPIGMRERRQTIVRSFACALRGVGKSVVTERNIKIHASAAALASIAAVALDLDRVEILFVLGAIALVVAAELVNTAVEAAVDLATSELHPLAGVAKDAAAGAVLVCSGFALAVAALVFGDKLAPLRLRPGGLPWAMALGAFACCVAALVARAMQLRAREARLPHPPPGEPETTALE